MASSRISFERYGQGPVSLPAPEAPKRDICHACRTVATIILAAIISTLSVVCGMTLSPSLGMGAAVCAVPVVASLVGLAVGFHLGARFGRRS